MLGYFLKLSWKNIWRNRRRTILTVNAIGIGVMALVFLHNYYDEFHEQLIHNVIRYHSGHLVVAAPNYHSRNNSNLYIKDASKELEWLSSQEPVGAWSGRVRVQGLASSAEGSANIHFVGIDPEREREVTHFASSIISGEFADRGDGKTIVLGKALSELLHVEVGSKVVALTQGVDGSIGNDLFRVRGIFDTKSDIDKGLAFISLSDARSLASLPPAAFHQVSVKLKKETDLEMVKAAFAGASSDTQMLSWKEVQRPVMAIIDLNKGVNRLLMIIILSVAAMGITNSILMSLMERTREFGVMMAIGTSKAEVTGLVIAETFLLCSVGVILGNILGVGVTTYFRQFGFDLKWFTSNAYAVEGAIIETVSYPVAHLYNSLWITGIILILSLVVSIIPARHIAKLSAVQALRAS
jgi:ABC-type lipoprotein release transport system permease subunit